MQVGVKGNEVRRRSIIKPFNSEHHVEVQTPRVRPEGLLLQSNFS